MLTRRELLAGTLTALLLPAERAHAGDDELLALPGKRPLIKRTFRPPNYETPLAELRRPFTSNDAFFVRYHLADIPALDPRQWRLRVGGASATRALELSLADLKRHYERVTLAAVNQCAGNRRGLFTPRVPGVQWTSGAMGNAQWTGVRLRDLLRAAGIEGSALEVVFDGADAPLLPATPDFLKSLPIDRALDENTLIAFEMNGEPLPHWNGAPARLVVPGWVGTYWVKHLTDIRIEPKAFDGFWMKTAYRIPTGAFPGFRYASQENAETTPVTEILVNSLITSHEQGARVALDRSAELGGWAWDSGSGIDAVEISTDAGQSWKVATLEREFGRYAWRGFRWRLDTRTKGPVTVLARAVSRAGARQPDKLTPNPSGYHHNLVQSVSLEVA
jgi:DMSO/TMAO reductase YedYZ molybdopterin-dependent catalytic subunit